MRQGGRTCIAVILAMGMMGTAHAVGTYSGSLGYSDGGITGIAGSPWLAPGTTFSWQVDDNGDGTYTYTYRLQVPDDSKSISHMTVEASPSFESDNILDVPEGTIAENQPDSYPNGGADPGMPDSMWGIKFDGGGPDSTDYDWTVSFTTDRAPVWGDFYAKDGADGAANVAIWNAGFTNPDSDPTDPAGDTPIANHILVPDTNTGEVPAPGGILLAGLGMSLVGYLRTRRWL